MLVIPSGITEIAEYAFYNCKNLESITIPASVKVINDGGLEFCQKLTEINFEGTMAEWKAIEKAGDVSVWEYYVGEYTVKCDDGNISKAEDK